MSDFTARCPFCGQYFTADTEWCGMSVCCPHCRQTVMIGTPEPPPEPDYLEAVPDEDTAWDDVLVPIYRLLAVVCFILAIFDMATPMHGINITGAYAGPGYFMMIGMAFAALGRMIMTGDGEDEDEG